MCFCPKECLFHTQDKKRAKRTQSKIFDIFYIIYIIFQYFWYSYLFIYNVQGCINTVEPRPGDTVLQSGTIFLNGSRVEPFWLHFFSQCRKIIYCYCTSVNLGCSLQYLKSNKDFFIAHIHGKIEKPYWREWESLLALISTTQMNVILQLLKIDFFCKLQVDRPPPRKYPHTVINF